MRAALRLVVVLLLVQCWSGCGRQYDGPRRYAVTGKVSYDGEPIDAGTISFLPVAGTSARVSGGEIVDGVFSVPEDRGANAGKYRVEIRWTKKTGKKKFDKDLQMEVDIRKEGLPPKFHEKSELTAEVSDGQTKFDFDLKSK